MRFVIIYMKTSEDILEFLGRHTTIFILEEDPKRLLIIVFLVDLIIFPHHDLENDELNNRLVELLTFRKSSNDRTPVPLSSLLMMS